MRVLLVNAFHYLRGGVERAYLDESRWLAAAGHEVAHFAIRDPRNLPSPTARHFAPAADYGEGGPAWRQLAQLDRVLWSRPAAQAMEGLLGEFTPDVAHVHAPSRYLTPSVLRPLERAGVPVVMTLHDYKPWCTSRLMFAHGAPCERCKGGRHWQALAVGCVHGSRLKSAVGMVEAYLHQGAGAYRAVRLWIAPSRFVRDQVVAFGVEPEKVRVLHHGVSVGPAAGTAATRPRNPGQPHVLFAGRLAVEKGVRLLPVLARRMAPTRVVAAGEGPMRSWLDEHARVQTNLKLVGHLEGDAFESMLAGAQVVIVPSLFYETYCYAAAEALLAARPVVASRIGAIPELVEHERTGLLAEPGDAHALAEAVHRALVDPAAPGWGAAGRTHVLATADPGRHLEGLLAIYREAMSR